MVWELKNKGFAQSGKPIILVTDFWRPLVDTMAKDDPGSIKVVEFARTGLEASQMLSEYLC
ncbi:MAG: hypothetical protein H8D47_04540 [Planctomycetes bacterium]|nr:hypothetical protein [Planctomycetota bacterium]MBL7105974.1 hypothetical protein [Phycisphaerae bacterium]